MAGRSWRPGLTAVAKQIYTGFGNRIPTVIVISAIYIIVNLILTAIATWAQKRFAGEKVEVTAVGALTDQVSGRGM